MLNCTKPNCAKLGFTKFGHTDKVLNGDPLQTRFEKEEWTFCNPLTKNRERMSVIDVITTQSNVLNSKGGNFKMFPPVLLPKEDLAHGFPQQIFLEGLVNTSTNGAKQNPKSINKNKDKPIENKEEWKKEWYEHLLSHQAENQVTENLSAIFTDWNSKGFMIQSYHSETYLQPLIEHARQQRLSKASVRIRL